MQCFNDKERGKIWKDYMESIISVENDCNLNVVGNAVKGPGVFICREEVL